MHILLLTQWFDPEPTFKGLAFAQALQEAGHQVEVITGFPNYPGGKIYPGYKLKLFQQENINGIKISRVFLFPSHDSSAIKRIINYLSFFFSAFLYGLFKIKNIDVIYVYHPPITVGLVACMLSVFKRIPYVLDIQDLWPDTLRATGMINNSYLLKIVGWFCRLVYYKADHLVVLSPGFKKILLTRNIPASKIDVIYNWANEKLLFSNYKNNCDLLDPDKFKVVFAGNMGKAQKLETVLLAAKRVSLINPNIQFVFVGGGVEVAKLKQLAGEQDISNVLFFPQRPMGEIGGILQQADVLLVHLKDDELFKITIPSKTQGYLACGRPILMAVKGDAADLISSSAAGICALPENIDSIVSSVLQFASLSSEELKLMGFNGKKFYEENLSFSSGVKQFLEVFNRIVTNR